MIYNKTFSKFLRMDNLQRINVSGEDMWIIPEEFFSSEEIEELRNVDGFFCDCGGPHTFANFLPDGERPEGVKKL